MPIGTLADHLRRFCEPALFHTEGFGDYHLTKGGSLFKAKLRGRYFVFTTTHQLTVGKFDHSQLCIQGKSKNQLLRSHRAVFAKEPPEGFSDFDCNLYEFTEPVRKGAVSSSNWYDLARDFETASLGKPVLAVCIGYPSYRNNIDYDAFQFGISPNAVWGRETASSLTGRLAFSPSPEIGFEPLGMSGAPVFGIEISHSETSCFFAGILTEASMSKFHFISRLRIKSLLREMLKAVD